MALYTQGITLPYNSVNAGVIQPDVFGVAINYFINRTPLAARLPKGPANALSFLLTNDNYRPRQGTFTADPLVGGVSLAVPDSSVYDVGDVIQIDSEYMQITGITDSTHVAITRGIAGTSAAAHATTTVPVYLISNARTGGDIDQNAMDRIPVTTTQYLQTIQHAYQVSGSLESATNYVSGLGTPMNRQKLLAMQHCMDDLEGSICYGKAQGLSSTVKNQSAAGFSSLLVTNNTINPTNAGAYKPSDLIRDTLQACRNQGGEPDVLVVDSFFMTGLSIWGQFVQRLDAGSTSFGTPIELFMVSFLPTLRIIEAPLLRKGTVICFNTAEARLRVKRPLNDYPRGRRGDAVEGDFIMEAALEVENEAHHAIVSGITGFAAS